MHNELTEQDLEMMRKELDHRKLELMPELIEEVKRTRAFGDLSENFEYKAAKQAQNRNRSRIRYLERMIKNARVIEDTSAADEVGLFDKVELYFEDDGETDTIQVVTSVRCDPLQGRISRDAPLGRAVLGKSRATVCRWPQKMGILIPLSCVRLPKDRMTVRAVFCEWRRSTELTGPVCRSAEGFQDR